MVTFKNKCENCKWLGTNKKCRLNACVNLSNKDDASIQCFIVNELLVFENEKLKAIIKKQNDFIDSIYSRLSNFRIRRNKNDTF